MISELWSDLRYRLRALLQRQDLEHELDAELRFHLEHEAEKYERAGLSRDESMRRARLAFGGVDRIKDDARDARGVALLDVVSRDVRYTFRGLRLAPGFTIAVVVTLALGIGATAGIFSVVDRLMFRPPAMLRDPSSVSRVYIAFDFRGSRVNDASVEYRRYLDLSEWTTSFSQVGAFSIGRIAVGSGQDVTEEAIGRASASLFDFFDARPVIGRFYSSQEDALPAGERVAVLGYSAWQRLYGGRRGILGTKLDLESEAFTIIGVAPEGFGGMDNDASPLAWIPATAYAALKRPNFYRGYNWGWLHMVVRRKPGISSAVALADINNAYRRSWQAERAIDHGLDAIDVAHPQIILGPPQLWRGPTAGPLGRVALWVGGVSLIALFVACANVANLMLARAFRRRREIAIRLTMGVSRSRLVVQLLTESVVLAALGGVAGLLLGHAVALGLTAIFGFGFTANERLLETRTLAFCAATTLVVALMTGLAPILVSRRTDLAAVLRSGVREGSYQRSRARTALVVLQGTLSTALLVAAGLFVRSLVNVRSIPLGYDVDPILLVQRNMRGIKLSTVEQQALMRQLEDRAAAIPVATSATRILSSPFYDHESTQLVVPGIDSVAKLGRFQLQIASPSYFTTMGTRIVMGRGISNEDRMDSPRVIVVSAEMARRLWPGRSAIGQCVRVGADTVPCSTVVGVAENIKERQLSHANEANYYLAADQVQRPTIGLFVRVRGRATLHADEVRRSLQEVMPGASYVTVIPFVNLVGDAQQSWKIGATMFAALGGLALVLAAIGLYSVIAYTVAQRSHELGLRIALGARVSDLMRLVIGEGVRLGIGGTLLGAIIAFASGHWVAPLLFDESPHDPVVFVAVIGVLTSVALLASVFPAVRAARVDPNVALRAE
jgi:putative ABC transport system permease protein